MEFEIFRSPATLIAGTYHILNVTSTVMTYSSSSIDLAGGAGGGTYQFYQSGNQIDLSDQLVVVVEPAGADGAPTEPPDTSAYVVHLPDISTLDRRMYHIVNSGKQSDGEVRFISDYLAGDTIMNIADVEGDPVDELVLDGRNAVQLTANLVSQIWYIL
jgi:hypothetical protein